MLFLNDLFNFNKIYSGYNGGVIEGMKQKSGSVSLPVSIAFGAGTTTWNVSTLSSITLTFSHSYNYYGRVTLKDNLGKQYASITEHGAWTGTINLSAIDALIITASGGDSTKASISKCTLYW